ncbi:fungal-specific transcription factor domain-containing protein [Emericellopsis atlantica]|uniref:Fungal-specific transcription factor domain-containing protein n=1 Tax=Emericellopsis atlantica TaxID=2614577 RepID=A0A9P8CQX8_9HYPO|nr:fungal-specific transcription factor domain-containing protein [Emericellopsis atlantica]KAG9256123.1 fungal-specific transcription factor domain-containing protein [Emericellopsis atlantica]
MSEARGDKVLSCASCRQRKVKCDKTQPICTQCSRMSLECVYPSRKPTRRVPRLRQSELLERIGRLEDIVGQADPAKLEELDKLTGVPATSASRTAARDVHVKRPSSAAAGSSSSVPGQPSKEATARYMSDEFWGHLCREVVGIKAALEQPSDDENDNDDYEESPESWGGGIQAIATPSGFHLGNQYYQERSPLTHPPQQTLLALWRIYTLNVDPLVKILHRPSINREIQQLLSMPNPYTPPPAMNALLFCIYFAAISTITPEQCRAQLGEEQNILALRYRLCAERALAAADYLNSNDLATLQAATLYVTMLRSYSTSRASWVLTGMIVRLAQAMNLHRDGEGKHFSPFEGEMRRRLWYFITVLDVRGAEDRGSDAILTPTSYNTIRPTNIDDEAFGPDTTEPLVPKTTPTENVVLVCMSRCTTFGHIAHPRSRVAAAADDDTDNSLHTEQELIDHVRAMENDFIHTVDQSSLPSRYAAEVSRLVILKLWLIVQYPFSSHPTVVPMRVSRATMLRTAVSVMELSHRMAEEPFRERFSWWTKCYVQWHPLAVALAELCVQTDGDLARRAWDVVEKVYPLWGSAAADSTNGPLWRPIKKLYKRAKAARAQILMDDLSLRDKAAAPPAPGPVSAEEFLLPRQVEPAAMVPSAIGLTQIAPPFDTMDMDPSILFQYPPATDMTFGDSLDASLGFDMGPWNDFLHDTQMNSYSPGSGSGSGSGW